MRKTIDYTVDAPGRDKGKTFVITEMPATQGEEWAARAITGMVKGGVQLPDEATKQGMAGVAGATMKALASIPWDDLKPLMTEMFQCIAIKPDPKRPQVKRDLTEDDIEEVTTRLLLRMEWFKLHTGFSIPAIQ